MQRIGVRKTLARQRSVMPATVSAWLFPGVLTASAYAARCVRALVLVLTAATGLIAASPVWAQYKAVEWNYNTGGNFYCTGGSAISTTGLATRNTCPPYQTSISSARISAATTTGPNTPTAITNFGSGNNFVTDDSLFALITTLGLAGLNTNSFTAAKTAGDYVQYSFTTASTLPAGSTLSTFAFANFTNLLTGTRFGGDLDFAVEISSNGFATAGTLLVAPRDYALLPGDATLAQNSFNGANYVHVGVPTNYILQPSTTYTFRLYLYNSDVGYADLLSGSNTIDDIAVFFDEESLITLTKALGSARANATDQFTVQIRDGATVLTTPGNDTSAGAGSTVTAGTGTTGATIVAPGTLYTLTEIGAGTPAANLAGYSQSIACTNSNTGSATVLPSGTAQPFTINSTSAADAITCTLTNTRITADLAISKTEATGTGVIPQNAGMSYNLIVWNQGPSATSSAIVTDTVPAGLTDVRWNCVASGTASCGALSIGSGNNISLTTGALPVNNVATPPTSGSYLTIGVSGIVASSSEFSNTATIAAAAGVTDTNSGNNTSTASITVVPSQSGTVIPGSVCGATAGAPPAAVSWYHNSPANTRNAAIDNPAIIASGAAETIVGLPGLTTAGTVDNMPTGAVPAAQSGGSYMQHQFTTANFTQYTELTQIGFGTFVPQISQNTIKTGTYQAQIQISTDPAFASSTTLTGTITVHDSGSPQAVTASALVLSTGGVPYEIYNFVRLNVPVPVRLLPATTYYMRVYPFNDTVAGYNRQANVTDVVVWDDFAVFANQCASPTVSLNKTTNGGAGGPFNFNLTNTTQATGTVTTTAAATPTQVDGNPVVAGIQAFTAAAPNADITISETGLPAGWSLGGATCTSAGNPVGSLTGSTYTIPAASVAIGATITCTFTNAKQPILRLQKQLPNGRFVSSDQFTLSIGGSTVTTTGTGSTATGTVTVDPATMGTSYAFSETGAAGANLGNYAVTHTCSNALVGGQAPNGSGISFSLTPVVGDDLTCTFVNTRNPLADLSITKTNTSGINGEMDQAGDTVTGGVATTYTIVVTNNGPDAVTGAVVRDPVQAGLACSDPVPCTGSGCPSATVPLSSLQAATGVTLGTMANGGTATFTLSCTVQ